MFTVLVGYKSYWYAVSAKRAKFQKFTLTDVISQLIRKLDATGILILAREMRIDATVNCSAYLTHCPSMWLVHTTHVIAVAAKGPLPLAMVSCVPLLFCCCQSAFRCCVCSVCCPSTVCCLAASCACCAACPNISRQACGRTGSSGVRFSTAAVGLPGRVMASVLCRIPHTGRDRLVSAAMGDVVRAWCSMRWTRPGAGRSMSDCRLSAVTSRGLNPVPPQNRAS